MSKAGFEKGVSILHFLGGSSVDLKGSRAIAQTKMTISQRGSCEGETVDVVCTGRFYDFFEKRTEERSHGASCAASRSTRRTAWIRSTRQRAQARSRSAGPIPEGYRHLGYLQTKLGFKVKRDLPQLKGAEVEKLYRHGSAWLGGAASAFPDGR